jgi:hypothetical protein
VDDPNEIEEMYANEWSDASRDSFGVLVEVCETDDANTDEETRATK